MRDEEHWLLTLADPERRDHWPENRLDAPGLQSLLLLAEFHGVLPNVARQTERFLSEEPGRLLRDSQEGAKILTQFEPVRRRLAERSAMALFLGAETRRLIRELDGRGVKIVPLKGVDVDLFLESRDWDKAAETMAQLGYLTHDPRLKYAGGYAERTWEHPAMRGAMVEVHDNLVNSPTVRKGVSVRLEDLPLERGGNGLPQPTPAGMLIIAAVHGAASHSFDKLQHLCDIAQVARGRAGPVQETELRDCIARTGAGFCVAAGLDLTARALGDHASADLLARLGPRWLRPLARWLVTPTVVLRSQGPRRRAVSWRRRLLRQMLKSRR
jgi:hypothetical protein